jgi:hypothetical protein
VYYRFRYRAKNEIGYGPLSEISYILTASIPEVPEIISTTIVGSDVVISWQMPYNSASLIDILEVEIYHFDGSGYSKELTYCDGSN